MTIEAPVIMIKLLIIMAFDDESAYIRLKNNLYLLFGSEILF